MVLDLPSLLIYCVTAAAMHLHLTHGAAFKCFARQRRQTCSLKPTHLSQDLYVAGSQEVCLHTAIAHLMHTIQPNTTNLQMPVFPYH